MKRILLTVSLIIVFMSGCSSKEEEKKVDNVTVQAFKNVKIVDKSTKREQTSFGWKDDYLITIGKNGQELTLHAPSEVMYDAVTNGLIVDVSINKKYYITHIEFDEFNGGK